MRSLLILINKYFWRGYVGPAFAFFIPLVLTLFIGRIVGPALVIPGAFSIPALCVLLVFMPQSIFEFKNSSILKRIGATPIRPIKFFIAIALYNAFIVLVAFLLLFVFCFAIFCDSLEDVAPKFIQGMSNSYGLLNYVAPTYMYLIKHADWASFIYTQLLMIFLAITIGLFIASVSKSTLAIQTIGIAILLVSLFVGPSILPISMVSSVDVVKYLGYIIPLKYPISLGIESFTSGTPDSIVNITSSSIWNANESYIAMSIFNSNKFDANSAFGPIEIFDKTDKILNQLMPWVWIGLFSYLTSCTFSWSSRGKTTFRYNVIGEIIREKRQNENARLTFNKNSNSENIIEIHNCTKKFRIKNKELIANNNISFNIKRNRNLAILGANGAGKTVLTEIIIGLNKPDSGNITYNFDFNKSFKEGLGIQFQESKYPFGIRCKDIVTFFIRAYHLDITENELNDMLEKFGILDFYNKNASSLSGGQQQRLNLLLSIIHKPKIIFLDELSTGLDIKIRTNIKKFIKEYAKKNNMTIVIVSHDMDEVNYLCEDIAVIKSGELKEYKTKKEILKKYKTLENYIEQYL